jgi:uncharacterized protein YbaR (Trm112 family)
MKARLRDILRCPRCRGYLADAGETWRCHPCGKDYPIVKGVPVFVPPDELETVGGLPAHTGYDPWLPWLPGLRAILLTSANSGGPRVLPR